MVECIKRMHDGTKFCVMCGENEVTDLVENDINARQEYVVLACVLHPY